jgi:hypothetical protein
MQAPVIRFTPGLGVVGGAGAFIRELSQTLSDIFAPALLRNLAAQPGMRTQAFGYPRRGRHWV